MVTALVVLLIICSLVFLALVIGSMYVIGLFKPKVARRVELILFTIANLKPSHRNARRAPKQLAKLAKILIYKRRLFANKIRARRSKKKLVEQKTRT